MQYLQGYSNVESRPTASRCDVSGMMVNGFGESGTLQFRNVYTISLNEKSRGVCVYGVYNANIYIYTYYCVYILLCIYIYIHRLKNIRYYQCQYVMYSVTIFLWPNKVSGQVMCSLRLRILAGQEAY